MENPHDSWGKSQIPWPGNSASVVTFLGWLRWWKRDVLERLLVTFPPIGIKKVTDGIPLKFRYVVCSFLLCFFFGFRDPRSQGKIVKLLTLNLRKGRRFLWIQKIKKIQLVLESKGFFKPTTPANFNLLVVKKPWELSGISKPFESEMKKKNSRLKRLRCCTRLGSTACSIGAAKTFRWKVPCEPSRPIVPSRPPSWWTSGKCSAKFKTPLVIQSCDLVGMVSSRDPFKGWKRDLQLGDEKGTLNHLAPEV